MDSNGIHYGIHYGIHGIQIALLRLFDYVYQNIIMFRCFSIYSKSGYRGYFGYPCGYPCGYRSPVSLMSPNWGQTLFVNHIIYRISYDRAPLDKGTNRPTIEGYQ